MFRQREGDQVRAAAFGEDFNAVSRMCRSVNQVHRAHRSSRQLEPVTDLSPLRKIVAMKERIEKLFRTLTS
jgi:hypothetical protein